MGISNRVSTGVAFWSVAAIFVLTMAGGTLPVPLYVLWAARFRFGAVTVTVLFAAYAVGTALALAVFGRISDQVGRRPVLAAALVLATVSSALFLTAAGTTSLVVARFLSGVATGLVTATATAALGELVRGRAGRAETVATAANLGGLGTGALVSGVLAEYVFAPTTLVYWLYLLASGAAFVVVLILPETVPQVRRPSIPVPRLALPDTAAGRRALSGAAAAMFAGFAVTGLFASLVPSFLRDDLHQRNLAVVGATVGLLFLVGMLVQVLTARPWWRPSVAVVPVLLIAGMGLVVAGLWSTSSVLVLFGTVLAGAGFGLATRSGVKTVEEFGDEDRRADLVATVFLAAYAGTTVSTVGLGLLTRELGEKPATTLIAAVVAVAALLAALVQRTRTRRVRER